MAQTAKIEKIRKHLLKKKNITSWEAITLYRVTRLAAVIHKLRDDDWNITTKMITKKDDNGESSTFAKYILNK